MGKRFVIPEQKLSPLPEFSHIKCCGRCPSNRPFDLLDPEAQDALKYGWEEYMRDFPCAWRPEGICKGQAVHRHRFSPEAPGEKGGRDEAK